MKKHLDIKATGERSLKRLEKDQLVIPESLEASDSFKKNFFFQKLPCITFRHSVIFSVNDS